MKTRIILASTSPRRIQLLQSAGITAQSASPDCDETPRRGESPRALVRRLALAKSRSVATGLVASKGQRVLVISADTIVVEPSGRRILGKPTGPADARRMLALISGVTHEVFTGFCVLEIASSGKQRHRLSVVRTKVKMMRLDASAIRQYVATGEPMDKAGSYAAQGLGMNFIEEIRGSYTNVVGLPMSHLLQVLEAHFSYKVPR